MLNYATQNYWRLRDENRWRDKSILDSVSQREVARPDTSGDDEGVAKSPNTEHAIRSFATAADLDEMGHWLNKIVEYWRADNAAAGLSVLDHKPLPKGAEGQVAETVWQARERGRDSLLGKLLAGSDPGVRLHVTAQLRDFLAARPRQVPKASDTSSSMNGQVSDLLYRRKPGEDPLRPQISVRPLPYSGEPVVVQPLAASASSPVDRPPSGATIRSAALLSPEQIEQQRADELDRRDPIAAIAHPWAYGLDSALSDLAGEEGVLGDWGWRRSVPRPSGALSGALGDATRFYLELGMPLGAAVRMATGATKLSAAGKLVKSALDTKGGRIVTGGALSVLAEWAAGRGKPPAEQPSAWDYGVAFTTGAVTGGYEGKRKIGVDVLTAIGGSIASDILSDRRVSVAGALGAGFGALIVTSLSKTWSDRARLGAQGFGRIVKKAAEKELKKYIDDVVGQGVEMTTRELNEFWAAFSAYAREQWAEFVERDDRDPIF